MDELIVLIIKQNKYVDWFHHLHQWAMAILWLPHCSHLELTSYFIPIIVEKGKNLKPSMYSSELKTYSFICALVVIWNGAWTELALVVADTLEVLPVTLFDHWNHFKQNLKGVIYYGLAFFVLWIVLVETYGSPFKKYCEAN